MFPKSLRVGVGSVLGSAAFVLGVLVWANPPRQDRAGVSTKSSEEVTLVGRVLAVPVIGGRAATLESMYETFVFGVESKERGGRMVVRPVMISHAFGLGPLDGALPWSFYDHSKLYELHVTKSCNGETVYDLDNLKAVDTSGRTLPAIKDLHILEGAPRELLKPELLLPCYVMYRDEYRLLRQDKAPREVPKSPKADAKAATSHP